jgi:oligopeptide/dipeptide ABC transporter ATP-binding protein
MEFSGRDTIDPRLIELLGAIPAADLDMVMKPIMLSGEIPSPIDPPTGCSFHPRCKYAQELCSTTIPEWKEEKPGHFAACHFAQELKLKEFST